MDTPSSSNYRIDLTCIGRINDEKINYFKIFIKSFFIVIFLIKLYIKLKVAVNKYTKLIYTNIA